MLNKRHLNDGHTNEDTKSEGASSVEVWNPFDGEWLPSRVVRFDVANDLALVEVPEAVRPAASTPAYGS